MGNNKKTRSPIDQKPLRRAGTTLRLNALKKVLIAVSLCIIPVAIWIGIILGILLSSFLKIYLAVVLSVIFLCAWGFIMQLYTKRIDESLDKLYLGLEGEIFVGELLESEKESDWSVLHDFIFKHRDGKSNIDHIVVAPQGVFTIETKTVSKRTGDNEEIYYDGKTITVVPENGSTRKLDSPLVQAQSQAKEIQKFVLKMRGDNITVQPIVVYPGWFVKGTYDDNKEEQQVWVCNPKFVKRLIAGNQQVLSTEQTTRIYSAIADHIRES